MTAAFAPWQLATGCTKGPQPGARAFMKWALDTYPAAGNDGIFNCRNVRGGSVFSAHAEGRADDVHFDLVDGKPNPAGWDFVEDLRPHAGELGVGVIIWAGRIWSAKSPGRNGRDYNGPDQHDTHAHVEFTRTAAAKLTLATIRKVMAGEGPGAPAPKHKAGSRALHPGDSGADVRVLQKALGVGVDGRFGPITLRAVNEFKRRHGWAQDGQAGSWVWAALAKEGRI